VEDIAIDSSVSISGALEDVPEIRAQRVLHQFVFIGTPVILVLCGKRMAVGIDLGHGVRVEETEMFAEESATKRCGEAGYIPLFVRTF
jgi:hypothetical protein